MDYVTLGFLVGRVLYGGFILKSAWSHFTNTAVFAGYAASKGVPMSGPAVLVSGAMLLVGGLGVLLGIYVQLAILALVLFFVPVTFMMHAYWKDIDPNMKMSNRVNFWKNIALLGAALMFLAIPEPWMYALF